MEDLLKVGVITTTHGVRGEVKVFPTTDSPERFLDLDYVILDTGRQQMKLEIQGVKFFKNLAIPCFPIDSIGTSLSNSKNLMSIFMESVSFSMYTVFASFSISF